jgi:ribose/xylose/arabinose/galactoside ABC-type transport system permease subunit
MFVTEPATMLTDYALTAVCAWFAFSLSRRAEGRKVGLWVAAFAVTAFAALAGGTAHGFRIPLGENHRLVWTTTVVAIAAGSALLVAAGIRSAMRPETDEQEARREGLRWLRRAIAVSLAGLAVLVLKLSPHPHFNHNDLYHVIQMGGLYCLYRGAERLHGLNGSDRKRGSGS